MKKRKLTVCLVAGVLILAVSAGAAFSSVNGYATYKNGVKKLLLETDNATLKGSYSLTVDGKEISNATMSYLMDGKNYDSRIKTTTPNGQAYENVDVLYNGVNTWYSSDMDPNTYYSNEIPDDMSATNILNIEEDGELERRMVTFFELAADTVVGDLKNNFVSLGKEDGLNRYQVDISENQVPAVVNAGLSLVAYSSAYNSSHTSYVTYEDFDKSFAAYYEQTTGQPISQEMLDNFVNGFDEEWVEANEDLIDDLNDVQDAFHEKYDDILEEKGDVGILYVKTDGSYDYYASEKDFYAAHPEEGNATNLETYLGEDMKLDTVSCTFAVDDQGRLVENSLTASFTTKDADGNTHNLGFTASLSAGDYGSTQVQPLDLSGWTDLNEDD